MSHVAEQSTDHPLELDSAFFVALEMTHESLKTTLKTMGAINVTQYKMLLKVYEYAHERHDFVSMKELGDRLGIRQNVATQAANALTERGYTEKRSADFDSRVKTIVITDAGERLIESVNSRINDDLESSFNPDGDEEYEASLVAATVAAAQMDEPFHADLARTHIASVTLMNFDIVLGDLADRLQTQMGLSYNDARILQRLFEIDGPARVADLSRQLHLPTNTVTRAGQRLQAKRYVKRLASPLDAKAVYLNPTEEAQRIRPRLNDIIDRITDHYFRQRLNGEQQEALSRVGAHFIDNIRIEKARNIRDSLTPA